VFVMFTPYSFIFFSLYNILLLSLFTISDFYYYWVIIELIILLFIGLRYTLFVSSYSQLIRYFLIQAISSFIILISYMYRFSLLITLSLLLKLSIFPFYSWYINVIYRFPNFIIWLRRTLHKIPVIIILFNFNIVLDYSLMWSSIVLTTLLSGIMILSVIDFRIVLILSSVGNNSWMLLGQITTLLTFLTFFIIYTISLFIVLLTFKGISKYSIVTSSSSNPYALSFWVLTLSGMPPFPLFYLKIIVLLILLSTQGINYFIFLFLVARSFILIGYIQSLIKFFIYTYSSFSHFLIKY
jgi:hypothetical protein